MQDDRVVELDFSNFWGGSVSAVARNTALQAIKGPADAHDFLCNRWPGIRGPAFAKAKRAAIAAISGRTSPEEARAAFIAACLQADCLVRTDV
ncbi:DUF982 domain-containing protein [Rhizobium halophilum]|uniref:DUF982 domain-containing protein n=1 Tax=Rhizobium halophilum TaxID=2846852 RepID=UPI001EFE9B34|nr:DUF982 domain-containing protein [Rhizobium halophilum]MCF6371076.1 DUF982 domain-containing protein [Rhizobium halophilum]